MRNRLLYTVLILVLCASALPGLDDIELTQRIELANITRPGPPVLSHRAIVFSYSQPTYARYVGVAFDFENFQIIHPFARNSHGVFVLLFEPPEERGEITYRIVVDGLWMPDPRNPERARDHKGNFLSRYNYELPPKAVLESPVIKPDGSVEFNVRYSVGTRVFLAGDFTNWEPFMIEMKETSPGLYTVTRRFTPGDYEYCFIAAGARMTDPLNPLFGTDAFGYLASTFTVR